MELSVFGVVNQYQADIPDGQEVNMSRVKEAVKQAMGWTDHQLEIYQKMGKIVEAMNAMDIKDLTQMTSEISRDEAIGPLLDPTAWRGHKFDEAKMIKTVVTAIINFKKEVSGIGRFTAVKPS